MISINYISLKALIFSTIVFLMSLSGCATKRTVLETTHGVTNPLQQSASPSQPNRITVMRKVTVEQIKEKEEVSSQELERTADAYFINGNLNLAFLNYEKCLQIDPRNARVLYKRGMLCLFKKLHEDAIETFNLATEIKPDYAPAYQGLGQAFLFTKQYGKAEKNLKKALQLNPQLWRSHNLLGNIYDYQGKYSHAVYEYAEAIDIRPEEGYLYNNIGVSYTLLGKYKEAIQAFHMALRKGYREKKVYNNLGLSLGRMRKYDEALNAFKKAGDRAMALNNLGFIYLNHAKYEKAIECFEKSIETSPSFYAKARENLKIAKTYRNQTR
jgi:tetratricopeptide (TPR) repeat protein